MMREVSQYTVTPKFTHDSTCCDFLGHMNGFDILTCTRGVGITILLRYGNEPHEYYSYCKFPRDGGEYWSASAIHIVDRLFSLRQQEASNEVAHTGLGASDDA